jgi:NAD(P)-dependent dehydrogenase (short-subunit alcohol dehydrogenase family)
MPIACAVAFIPKRYIVTQILEGQLMGQLDGKVAIITGGTSGIGEQAAAMFASEGAKVVIAGRREAEGNAVAARLGENASFIKTDMLDEAQVEAMVAHALTRFGRVDCLFNNAGGGGPPSGGIAELDMQSFDANIAINLRTAVLGMKHAAKVMKAQRSGSIINTASLGGLRVGYTPFPYATAKAALIHATRWVANELGPYNVRVNSISPGGIVTGIFAKGSGLPPSEADRVTEGIKDLFATIQPIPRAGLPDDVASAALFLASGASSFITGHDIVIDGGMGMGQNWEAFTAFRAEIGRRVQPPQQ